MNYILYIVKEATLSTNIARLPTNPFLGRKLPGTFKPNTKPLKSQKLPPTEREEHIPELENSTVDKLYGSKYGVTKSRKTIRNGRRTY